ncbi:MAG: hypothetical protein COB88_09820 [Flavobacteriales bacterium]|nr:MAG: hypothetical protein COB88_09820 [Flavobacteriales bacterium]
MLGTKREREMDVRKTNLGKCLITLFLFAGLVGCGSDPSPIESMAAPIRLVRNDSIHQVEDNKGRLYILNSVDKVNYSTQFIELGGELTLLSSGS